MFSNGSEYDAFLAINCERCKKYVLDSIGGGCLIEEKISTCSITGKGFPNNDLIPVGYRCRYLCKEFHGETEELQRQYLKAREEYGSEKTL